jgi:hypothetical protein
MYGNYEQRLDQDRLPAPGRPRRIDRSDIDGTDTEIRAVIRPALRMVRLSTGIDLVARHEPARGTTSASLSMRPAPLPRRRTTPRSTRRTSVMWVRFAAGSMCRSAPASPPPQGARGDHVRSVNEGGFFGTARCRIPAARGIGRDRDAGNGRR